MRHRVGLTYLYSLAGGRSLYIFALTYRPTLTVSHVAALFVSVGPSRRP